MMERNLTFGGTPCTIRVRADGVTISGDAVYCAELYFQENGGEILRQIGDRRNGVPIEFTADIEKKALSDAVSFLTEHYGQPTESPPAQEGGDVRSIRVSRVDQTASPEHLERLDRASLNDSDWVEYEIKRALENEQEHPRTDGKRKVFPIMIDDSLENWNHHLQPQLWRVLAGDFRKAKRGKAFDEAVDRLLKGLSAVEWRDPKS